MCSKYKKFDVTNIEISTKNINEVNRLSDFRNKF